MKNFIDLNVGDVFSYKDVWQDETLSKFVAIVEKKTSSKLSLNIFFVNDDVDDGTPQKEYTETLWIKGAKLDERYVFDKFLWTENVSKRLDRLKEEFPNVMNL